MSITFPGTPTTVGNVADATEITVGKPADVANGEYLEVVIGCEDASGASRTPIAWTPAAGFSLVRQYPATEDAFSDDEQIAVFRKKITDAGNEPASYTFQAGGGFTWSLAAICTRIAGVDPDTPEDAAPQVNAGNDNTPTFKGVTTQTAGAVLVGALMAQRALTVAYNDSMTEVAEATGGDPTDTPNQVTVAYGHLEVESAGATGDKTATLSASRDWKTISYALRPAAPAAPTISSVTKIQGGKNLTISGSAFGAAAGSNGAVILSPADDIDDQDAETQAIDSWSATEIVTDGLTLPSGLGPGDPVYVFVVDDDEAASEGLLAAVADPALIIEDTLTDTDADTAVSIDPLEAIVIGGTAGGRTMALNVTDAAVVAGALVLRDAAFSIEEIEDTYLVVVNESDTRKSVHPAVVVDLNEVE